MTIRTRKPALDAAAAHLRALSISSDAGTFFGREDSLVEQLGVARATLRQAARLLEQEGLLKVKRGANGGYFAARPDTKTIEGVLGTYLDSQRLDFEETFTVGNALWAEAVFEATELKSAEIRASMQQFRKRIEALGLDPPMFEIFSFENDFRRTVFRLIKRPYLELFFSLNRNVTWRYLDQPPWHDGRTIADPSFMSSWRDIKLEKFAVLEHGDVGAAYEVTKRARNLWRERLFASGIAIKRSS